MINSGLFSNQYDSKLTPQKSGAYVGCQRYLSGNQKYLNF
jgi:hypothetical protein